MNVERLTRVVADVLDSLVADAILAKAQALQSSLERSAANPGNTELQQEVVANRSALSAALDGSRINSMPQLDLDILEDLGVSRLVASVGASRVDEAFHGNDITPAVAASEIASYVTDLSELTSNLEYFRSAASYFGISPEELDPGVAELAVLVPRMDVREEAVLFARELTRLDTFVRPFYEVNGESPKPSRLAAISSSDYGVYLDLAPHVALSVGAAVAFVLSQYKKVLEIRLLSSQVEALKSDSEDSDAHFESAAELLKTAATNLMSQAIDKHVETLDLDLAIDDGRKNELKASLRVSYRYIAERVDRGYNFDVRVGDDDEAEDDESEGTESVAQAIRNLGPDLTFINRSGKPILELNATNDVDTAADADDLDEAL